MSTGIIKQFVDFTTSGDTNQNEADAIEPVENGENVIATVTNRPPENLRVRSETIRGILEDLLYLVDADRHIFVGGPGTVTWPGASPGNTGIFTLSDNVYIIPALTPGNVLNTPPVPPVGSVYGTLTLAKAGGAAGLILTSCRRSYAGGDRINVTVVEGTPLAVTAEVDGRTVTITTPSTATLDEVRVAINALTADTPATQLLTAVVDGGALGTDLIDSTQVQQFISGNYDGEGHTIVPTTLVAFFAADGGANVLKEGDSLCVWYAYLRDPAAPPTYGGRREAIPENTNTAIPVGSFFNSRVHPERLVNALPIAKVINGYLCFVSGLNVPAGTTGASFNNSTYNGSPAWYDGTTNPPTTFDLQFDKIVTDLIATTAAHSGADKLGCAARTDWLGGTTKANAAASLFAAINKIVTDLGLNAAATDDGAIRLGAAAVTDLAQGSVRSQLTTLAADWAKLARSNTFTALQNLQQTTFNALVDTEANARLPRVEGNTAFYTLLAKWNITGKSLRVYVRADGYLYITWNAYWDGTDWHADGPGGGPYLASRISFLPEGTFKIEEYRHASNSNWSDAAWTAFFTLDNSYGVDYPLLQITQRSSHGDIAWFGDHRQYCDSALNYTLNHFGYPQYARGPHILEHFHKLDTDLWIPHVTINGGTPYCTVDPAVTSARHNLELSTPVESSEWAILAPKYCITGLYEAGAVIQFKMYTLNYGTSGIYFGIGDSSIADEAQESHFYICFYAESGNWKIKRRGLTDIDLGFSVNSDPHYCTLQLQEYDNVQWWLQEDRGFGTSMTTGTFSMTGATGMSEYGPRMAVASNSSNIVKAHFDYVEVWY